MAVDPIIARGTQPLDVSNALLGIAGLRQRDKALAQDQQVIDFRQNALMQAQQDRDEQDDLWDQGLSLISSGDPNLAKQGADILDRIHPGAGKMVYERRYPQQSDQGIKIGQYNPGDYTPQTWSKFLETKDPSVLARQYAPPSPPNQTVIQLPQGQAAFNPRTGQTTLLSGREDQRAAEAADAAATTAAQEGAKAAADKQVKRGPQASMDYIIDKRFRPLLVNGYGSYKGIREFNNLRQQLSTELRTIFRIPGEGTLSDKEQAQYGLQLPSVFNPASLNGQILTDIQNRIGLRLGDGQVVPTDSGGGLTPEEQAELEELRKRFKGR